MDAQQQQDLQIIKAMDSKPTKGSRKKLETLLKDKKRSSVPASQLDGSDWVGRLVSQNPSLTREDVVEMAEDLGL